MFHADRWDYVFYFKRGSTNVVQQRDFVVTFAGDRVASWTGGDDLPSNLELLAEIDGDKRGKKGAAAPAAASGASASTAAPVTVDPVGAPSTDANAEAAQAANRATNAVQTPSRNAQPSVRSAVPTANAGGVPAQGGTAAGQPQFQFHRPPPPQNSASQDNPVGPTDSQSGSGGPTYNAPLTAADESVNGRLSTRSVVMTGHVPGRSDRLL